MCVFNPTWLVNLVRRHGELCVRGDVPLKARLAMEVVEECPQVLAHGGFAGLGQVDGHVPGVVVDEGSGPLLGEKGSNSSHGPNIDGLVKRPRPLDVGVGVSAEPASI